MSFNPAAEPWRSARAVLAMDSVNAVSDMMFIYRWLDRAGRFDEADAVVAILNAVLALGASHDPGATIH